MTQTVPNPYFCGTQVPVNRLQELVTREQNLLIHVSETTVTLRLEGNSRTLPDLEFVIQENNGEKYVDVLTSVSSCYNPDWVPTRKMDPQIKWFLAKLMM